MGDVVTSRDRSLDIAVTGIAARLPGPRGMDEWWDSQLRGTVHSRRYTREELLAAGVPAALADDPDYVPVRGHLDDWDRFDHDFFQIRGREAELMDPQHRWMLEVAHNALADAGVAPRDDTLVTSVYASMTGSGYMRAMVRGGDLDPGLLDDVIHGTEPDFMASRVAYRLGLTGPAFAVQTACSSSLVAVHLAVQALLGGDCDQALVVGAGFGYPQAGHLHQPGGVLSATGACRPFDRHADGVIAGSGAGAVVLRRLSDVTDDDPEPYGVILGSAINNDGHAKAGYYAPSSAGQERVIGAALDAAEVDGGSLGYLEAHGTGTRIGDPIEWTAANAALRAGGARPGSVAVGALKAGVGHLDAAAGVAALIRALLVVRSGVIPPVAGFTEPNPLLETGDCPLYIPTEAVPWPGEGPRRAGVSAFGIGGTNAHVVIEQPPPRKPTAPGAGAPHTSTAARMPAPEDAWTAEHASTADEPGPTRVPSALTAAASGDTAGFGEAAPHEAAGLGAAALQETASPEAAVPRAWARAEAGASHPSAVAETRTSLQAGLRSPVPEPPERLVLVSAADSGALERVVDGLAVHLVEHDPDLGEVCRTLAKGRAALGERLTVTGRTSAEVAERLAARSGTSRGTAPVTGPAPVVLLFPGGGTQRPGMAEPFTALPGFRPALDRCLAAFPTSLSATIRRAVHDPDFPADELNRPALAQPALFAVGHAAATALMELGVRPAAVCGHSSGEITAATVAGVFGLEEAAAFITARGRAMQECPEGAMVAIGADVKQALALAEEWGLELDVAAVNGPDSCVLGGPAEQVDEYLRRVGDTCFVRRLRYSHAGHSRLIEPALPALTRAMSGIELRPSALPIALNESGRVVPAGTVLPPDTFVTQVRRSVLFGAALDSLAEHLPGALAVEIGPGRPLSPSAEAAGLPVVALDRARDTPGSTALAGVGALWALGQPITVGGLTGEGRRARLPGYPFSGPRSVAPEALAPTENPPRTAPLGPPTGAPGEQPTRAPEEEPAGASAPPTRAPSQPLRPPEPEHPAPLDPTEGVTRIWAELLGRDDFPADADFFAEGGDSLLITRLIRRVNNDFEIRVPVREMLARRTLNGHIAVVHRIQDESDR
ncbi:beta-ketoacyl synthase N-terminal-like domain-containing protein [Streptomyces sp. SP17KL33]|nr:beta-ketoacyl synthase N-terminal-like domain-containing protein [Streptomyces sp. SP17KL33]MEE1836251.1 beta-ketoacyl synthase N-terminal-like domain-containing protein [Streptomyces sp. SP17KL33]